MAYILSLAIDMIPFLPARSRALLAKKYTNEHDFSTLHGQELMVEFSDLRLTKYRQEAWQCWHGKQALIDAEKLYEQLQKRHIGIIDMADASYPSLLKEIHDPPFLLYYRGTFPSFHLPQLAIVGTRRPSVSAKEETSIFTKEIAPHVGSIVSGLALGVDGQAHRAALAVHGHTTAILGGGFDHLYPNSHKSLAARIIDEGGLILSEYAPSVSPTNYTFPARNRIIAGMCQGTVIIEAPHKSGSLITGQFALDQGRDLFVHAIGIANPDSGTGQLYEQGAIALRRGEDLLSAWGILPSRENSNGVAEANESGPNKLANESFDRYDIGAAIAKNLWQELSDEDLDDLF
ncbi:DNA-processing protein DprA [Entomospira culicis]|uniref:DNA-protecting protein DprA n=1 Tax=Entomospira culicis TaxID=2719989 RepID=A0A968GFI8_9SPIO|nr:DNA-processing protein DprA [Entomospira culicis]NIZ19439.1 DNA-protecting protein DprA [Entomospira culicis]NIZ69656.1 DNA-protecting protein DprA [Entomospira culicis]WDI36767.1 DNA-processing protein DprA [Entomospira culicis]WDI38396.1 DNA-processing protein DprA [Entomospira culicis]